MALHATIIVPKGTTDEKLEKARQEALTALMQVGEMYVQRMKDPKNPEAAYWRKRYESVMQTYNVIKGCGFTSLIP